MASNATNGDDIMDDDDRKPAAVTTDDDSSGASTADGDRKPAAIARSKPGEELKRNPPEAKPDNVIGGEELKKPAQADDGDNVAAAGTKPGAYSASNNNNAGLNAKIRKASPAAASNNTSTQKLSPDAQNLMNQAEQDARCKQRAAAGRRGRGRSPRPGAYAARPGAYYAATNNSPNQNNNNTPQTSQLERDIEAKRRAAGAPGNRGRSRSPAPGAYRSTRALDSDRKRAASPPPRPPLQHERSIIQLERDIEAKQRAARGRGESPRRISPHRDASLSHLEQRIDAKRARPGAYAAEGPSEQVLAQFDQFDDDVAAKLSARGYLGASSGRHRRTSLNNESGRSTASTLSGNTNSRALNDESLMSRQEDHRRRNPLGGTSSSAAADGQQSTSGDRPRTDSTSSGSPQSSSGPNPFVPEPPRPTTDTRPPSLPFMPEPLQEVHSLGTEQDSFGGGEDPDYDVVLETMEGGDNLVEAELVEERESDAEAGICVIAEKSKVVDFRSRRVLAGTLLLILLVIGLVVGLVFSHLESSSTSPTTATNSTDTNTTTVETANGNNVTTVLDPVTFGFLMACSILSTILGASTVQWTLNKGLLKKDLFDQANKYNVLVAIAATSSVIHTWLCFFNNFFSPTFGVGISVVVNWTIMVNSSMMMVSQRLSWTFPDPQGAWKRLLWINYIAFPCCILIGTSWAISHNLEDTPGLDKFVLIIEPIQIALFGIIEFALSGAFIVKMWKFQWTDVERKGIFMLFLVGGLDLLSVLLNLFMGDLESTCVKGLVYSLRIRLEVNVLNCMAEYIRSQNELKNAPGSSASKDINNHRSSFPQQISNVSSVEFDAVRESLAISNAQPASCVSAAEAPTPRYSIAGTSKTADSTLNEIDEKASARAELNSPQNEKGGVSMRFRNLLHPLQLDALSRKENKQPSQNVEQEQQGVPPNDGLGEAFLSQDEVIEFIHDDEGVAAAHPTSGELSGPISPESADNEQSRLSLLEREVQLLRELQELRKEPTTQQPPNHHQQPVPMASALHPPPFPHYPAMPYSTRPPPTGFYPPQPDPSAMHEYPAPPPRPYTSPSPPARRSEEAPPPPPNSYHPYPGAMYYLPYGVPPMPYYSPYNVTPGYMMPPYMHQIPPHPPQEQPPNKGSHPHNNGDKLPPGSS